MLMPMRGTKKMMLIQDSTTVCFNLLRISVLTADIKLMILYLMDCDCSPPNPASGCAVQPTFGRIKVTNVFHLYF
jgi:hypothetical protein